MTGRRVNRSAYMRIGALLLAVGLLGPATGADAQIGTTTTAAPPTASAAFSVQPPTAELSATPGQTITKTFTLSNPNQVQQTVAIETGNFKAGGPEGSQPIFTETEGKYALSPWMTVSPLAADIAPNDSALFTVTISVPADAAPGGHFGFITFHQGKIPAAGTVRIDQAVTALVLLTVAGPVQRIASISDFSARTAPDTAHETGKKETSFSKDTANLVIGIKNDGSVAEHPHITVVVKNSIGRKVATLSPAVPGNVLPGSTRIFTMPWHPSHPAGRYTAKATVTFENGYNARLTATTTYWMVGTTFKTLLAVILVFLVLLVRAVVSRRRRKSEKAAAEPNTDAPVDNDDMPET